MEGPRMEDLIEVSMEEKTDYLRRAFPLLGRDRDACLEEILPMEEKTDYHHGFVEVSDSRGRTALHVAAGKGHIEIARPVAVARPQMCEAADRVRLNSLHMAVIRGNENELRALVQARPQAALGRARHGRTILHLCVKYHRMKALDILLAEADDDQIRALVNTKDDYGRTVLHLAVAEKQTQMVNYLLASGNIDDVNATDANGLTALDILTFSPRSIEDWDIGNHLIESGALRATNIASTGYLLFTDGRNPKSNTQGEWLAKKNQTLLLIATLLAAMAFQAVMSPPGGLLQENSPEHRAGEAVIAYSCPDLYELFIYGNTMGFMACLSTILLLLSGLPFKHKSFLWILMVNVWLSIVSIVYTYLYTIVTITPEKNRGRLRRITFIAVPFWSGLMFLIVHWQIIRSMGRWLLKKYKNVRPPTNYSVEANHAPDNQDVQIQMTDRCT